jgi:hypothetical protein
MTDGIPPPAQGELVFRVTLPLTGAHEVGNTQYGRRRILELKGASVTGDRFKGSFLDGGLDLELTLSNGSVELEQVDMLRASDGTLVYLRTCGVAPAGDSVVRIVPDFEVATSSALSWLNTGKFAGTRSVDAASSKVEIAIYDVSKVSAGEPRVRVSDPAGVPNQTWECSTQTGAKGASVFTEAVLIGSSLSVGASKRGTRNVIPITGGTTSGRVVGSILKAGADYQLIGGGSTRLDARYAVSTNDKEFVLIRNCGAFGALIPLFEARADGPYSFLNKNSFVSSDPGSAAGGVSITFYERN